MLPAYTLAVAVGGAAGAVLRHIVVHHAHHTWTRHPYAGTLVVNLAGSLAAGAILGWLAARPDALSDGTRHVVTIGLLGAFTTYSAFAVDALKLIDEGRTAAAAWYILATTVGALLAAGLAFALVRSMLSGAGPP